MRTTNTELRPWCESDAEHLLRASGVSDDLGTQVGDVDLSTLDRCQEFIAFQLRPSSPSVRNFAISVDGAAVGNVGIGHIEHRHDTGWLHYWVSAEARGQSLASRSLASAAHWERDLFRLELGHRVNNPNAETSPYGKPYCLPAQELSWAASSAYWGPQCWDLST